MHVTNDTDILKRGCYKTSIKQIRVECCHPTNFSYSYSSYLARVGNLYHISFHFSDSSCSIIRHESRTLQLHIPKPSLFGVSFPLPAVRYINTIIPSTPFLGPTITTLISSIPNPFPSTPCPQPLSP